MGDFSDEDYEPLSEYCWKLLYLAMRITYISSQRFRSHNAEFRIFKQ